MGKHYRKSSHSVFSIEVHIVWISKYRYKVLKGDVAIRTRDLIRRICTEENAEILSGVVSDDHVHILVSIDRSIHLNIQAGTVFEGKELAETPARVSTLKEALLGSAPVGQRVLCSEYRKCLIQDDRRVYSSPF